MGADLLSSSRTLASIDGLILVFRVAFSFGSRMFGHPGAMLPHLVARQPGIQSGRARSTEVPALRLSQTCIWLMVRRLDSISSETCKGVWLLGQPVPAAR